MATINAWTFLIFKDLPPWSDPTCLGVFDNTRDFPKDFLGWTLTPPVLPREGR